MKKGPGGRWLVVYMCRSARMKEAVEQLLRQEGFLVRCRRTGPADAYELCVLESEAQEARKLLIENGL